MRIGGFKWGDNTCGCGHGAHCHLPVSTLCMYSEAEGGHPAGRADLSKIGGLSPSTCDCMGYIPRANWINELLRQMKMNYGQA
jgi:hypothetical protein